MDGWRNRRGRERSRWQVLDLDVMTERACVPSWWWSKSSWGCWERRYVSSGGWMEWMSETASLSLLNCRCDVMKRTPHSQTNTYLLPKETINKQAERKTRPYLFLYLPTCSDQPQRERLLPTVFHTELPLVQSTTKHGILLAWSCRQMTFESTFKKN